MNFEIHITVEVKDLSQFITDCNVIGVKPIIIETEPPSEFEQQVMTSSKHNGDDYKETLSNLIDKLKNYKIVRSKVEIQPETTKHPTHQYYESHLRLRLPKDYNRDIISDLCKKLDFHLSRNLLKKDDDISYQMITYRNHECDFNDFNSRIDSMYNELQKIGVICDKKEIEECVYDSNIKIDNNWLNF